MWTGSPPPPGSPWPDCPPLADVYAAARRAFIGAKPYRLGPTTIGMRQNPYGSRTMPNPHDRRMPMAADDPRTRGLFGAAFTVGYAARLAESTVEAWCGSSFAGPRGLFDRTGRPTPSFDVACGQARASGRARLSLHSSDRARVDGFALRGMDGRPRIRLANLSARPQRLRLSGDGVEEDMLTLGLYEVAERSGIDAPHADQAP